MNKKNWIFIRAFLLILFLMVLFVTLVLVPLWRANMASMAGG